MYFHRYLRGFLAARKGRRLLLLTGARQTGKTTLIRATWPRMTYLNLDAPEIRDQVQDVSSFAWGRDIGNALFDEAQKEPGIFEKIKYAFDAKEVSFSVLTGSSQILLLKQIRESLAGRVVLFELWPLLFAELVSPAQGPPPAPPFLHTLLATPKGTDVCAERPSRLIGAAFDDLQRAFRHLSLWGGMPALPAIPPEERRKWLQDYEYTYLQRDLADLARINDLQPFRQFQRLAALRTGCLLSYSQLARDAGISVDTARRYLEYLRLSYQAILLPPFHRNLTSSAVKTPKLHWLDIGLCRSLTGNFGELTGEMFESLVVAEVYKWVRTAGENAELFFYRTHAGAEIDMLIQTPHGFVGIEAKLTQRPGRADARVMREVARVLGKEWRGGLVVYRGQKLEPLGEAGIWAIPFPWLFMPFGG